MNMQRWEQQAIRLQPPNLPTAVFPARSEHPTNICSYQCDICYPPITKASKSEPEPTPVSPLWTPSAPKAPAPKLTYRTIEALANGTHTPAVPLKPAIGGSTLILPPTPDSHRRLALFAEVDRRRAIAERATPAIAEIEAPFELVDLLISTKTQLAQLEATQLAAINELSTMYPGHREFLPTEVALALRVTDTVAQDMLDLGYYLPRRYPKTWVELQSGRIRAEAAKLVHQHLENCSDDIAGRVDSLVAPKLAELRPGQIARLLTKTILQVDGAGAQERHRKRRADRHVYRYPAAEGMAHLGFYSTAADINIIFEGITAAAETAWIPGDSRTNNQRRIDTLVDLMRQSLDRGTLPASVHSIPADLGASAPSPVNESDRTPLTGASDPVNQPARRGPASAAKYSIGVLIPMNTLLGGDDPGYITGQGWITPHQARVLATDHTWRRILTDPVNEQIINIGRTRYRPPAAMAEYVRTRDQYCAAPGCVAEAKNCALDHIEPFNPGEQTGGETSADNLTPLCEHHHRAKDGGGFTLRRTAGVFHWTTPMERQYQHHPDHPWLPGPNSPHHPDNWGVGSEHEFDERVFGELNSVDPSEPTIRSSTTSAAARVRAA